jgi:hypothetical protein
MRLQFTLRTLFLCFLVLGCALALYIALPTLLAIVLAFSAPFFVYLATAAMSRSPARTAVLFLIVHTSVVGGLLIWSFSADPFEGYTRRFWLLFIDLPMIWAYPIIASHPGAGSVVYVVVGGIVWATLGWFIGKDEASRRI